MYESHDIRLLNLLSGQHYESSQGEATCMSPDSLIKSDECLLDEPHNDIRRLMPVIASKEPFNYKLNTRITSNIKYKSMSKNEIKNLEEILEDTITEPFSHQTNRLLFLDYLLKSDENANKKDQQNVRFKKVRQKRCHLNIFNKRLTRICKVNKNIRQLNGILSIKKINPIHKNGNIGHRDMKTTYIKSAVKINLISSSVSVETEKITRSTSSVTCDQPLSDSSSAACDQPMSDIYSAACDQPMSDSSSAACDQPMSDSSSAACDQPMSDSSSAACDQPMSDSSSAVCDQQMSDSSSAACDQQMLDNSSAACDQQMSDSFSLTFYSPDSLESRSSLESGKEGKANEFVFPHEQTIFSDYTMPVGYNTIHQTKNDDDVKVNNNLPVRVETKCFHQSFFPLCSNNLDKTVLDICDRHIYHSNRQMLYRDTVKPLLNNSGGEICDISVYAPHKCSTFLIAEQPNFEENDFMLDNVENRLICNAENTHLTSVIQSINLKKSFLQEQINEVASEKIPKELATRKKGSKILLDQSEIKKYDVSAIQAKVGKSEMSVDQREIHESEMSAAQAEISLDQSKLDESLATFEHVGDNDRSLIMEDINSSIKLSQILKKTRNKKNNQNMKKTTSQSRLQHTGPFVCQPTSLPTWSLQVDDFYYKKRRQMKHMNFSKSSLIQSCKSLIQRPQSKSRFISSLPLPLTQKPINDSNDYISSRFHKLGMSCKFSSARSPPKWTCPNIEYSKRFIKSKKRTKSEQKSIPSVTYMMNSSRPGCRLKTMCMRRNKVGLVSTRCFNVCQTHVPVLARSTPEVYLNTINNQHGQNKNFTQFKHKRSISKYVPHNLQTKQYLKATRQSTHSVNVYSKFKPPVDLCYESSPRVNGCHKSKPSVKLYDKSKPSVNGCDKFKPSIKLYDKSKSSVNGWDKFKPSVKLCDKSKSSANVCDKSKPSIKLCDKSKPSVKFCDKSKPSFYVRDKSKHSDHKSNLQASANSANTIQKDPFRTKRLSSNSSELPGDKDVFARLAVSHSKCIGDTSSLCCQLLKDVSESSCSWVFAQDDIKNVWALNKKFSDKTCTEKKNKKDVENVGIRYTSRNKNILDINSLKRVVACVKALINKQNTLLKAIDDTIELLQLKEHILDPFKAYDVHFNMSDKETLISKQDQFKRSGEKNSQIDNVDQNSIDSRSNVALGMCEPVNKKQCNITRLRVNKNTFQEL